MKIINEVRTTILRRKNHCLPKSTDYRYQAPAQKTPRNQQYDDGG